MLPEQRTNAIEDNLNLYTRACDYGFTVCNFPPDRSHVRGAPAASRFPSGCRAIRERGVKWLLTRDRQQSGQSAWPRVEVVPLFVSMSESWETVGDEGKTESTRANDTYTEHSVRKVKPEVWDRVRSRFDSLTLTDYLKTRGVRFFSPNWLNRCKY